LWDYIFRGELIYPLLREKLRARYPGVKFIDYTEFGNIHGPKQREIVAGLAGKLKALGCDAVISGIGA
ncbi:MAG TPA: UGSC family (seleno)protein, partial [Burkholderiales bacterium]|nr:UGSC family (seleno)protein [Burkholderiales bacterium]